MAAHEEVDGFIPGAPVGLQIGAVPPIVVEVAVAEHGDLGQGIQKGLKQREEAGQPDDEGDGGEFHQAFEDGGQVEQGDLVEGVAE